jgi:hypothetical protein
VLKKPSGYSRIWRDLYSGANRDGSFWRVNCPKGYGSLSDVCQNGWGNQRLETHQVWCVNMKYLKDDNHDRWIWNDKGSGSYYDVDINGGESSLTRELISATDKRGRTKTLKRIANTYL